MRRFGTVIAICLLFCEGLSAQNVSPHARDAVETIRELRAIGIPEASDWNNIPGDVPPLLRKLNRQLLGLITEILNEGPHTLLPGQLWEKVAERLNAAGWQEILPHKWNAYGELVDIETKDYEESGLLVVVTKLWLPCEAISDPDSSIYVYQRKEQRWELLLAGESDYAPGDQGEQTGIQYGIAGPDSSGSWALVLAHAPPSCRFVQRKLNLKVLRAGPSPDRPVTVYAGQEAVEWGFEPPFELRVEPGWFALTWGGSRKLDGEPGVFISRFEIHPDRVLRIPPLALVPEDFLDQWIQLPWNEAKRWVESTKELDLSRWHEKLGTLSKDSAEINFVQPCPRKQSGVDTWLVGLWMDSRLNPSFKDENLYVTVRKQLGAFYVDSIDSTRPEGCPGNTRPPLRDLKLPLW